MPRNPENSLPEGDREGGTDQSQQSGSEVFDAELADSQERGNASKIDILKASLKRMYENPKETAKAAGKGALKYGVYKPAKVGMGALKLGGKLTIGSIGFSLLEVPKTLWREVKIISKILWKTAKGEKPPSFSEIWKYFFDKNKEGKKE